MYNQKDLYQLAERLISVTYGVLNTYDLLGNSFTDNNLYNKNLEYLKVAFEIENDLYKKIGNNLLTSKEFNNALRLAFENTNYDESTYEEIHFRIYNYIDSIIYYYPFRETRYYPNENIVINNETIDRHIVFDINLLDIYNLEQIMNNEKLSFLLPYLIDAKHLLLFRCKFYDNLAFKELTNAKPTSRERLLKFNHNKEIIDAKFNEIIENGLRESIEEAFSYEDSSKDNEDYCKLIINLVQIKTHLDLTTRDEAFDVFRKYYNLLEHNDNLKYLFEKSSVNKNIKILIKNNLIEKSDNSLLKV